MYDRSSRQKQTQEYFTQPAEVEEVLTHWTDDNFKTEQTWIDTSCGSGNILKGIYDKLLLFHSKEKILNDLLFGCDYEIDNMVETIQRLYNSSKIVVLTDKDIPTHMKANGLLACFMCDDNLVTNFVCCDSTKYPLNFGRKIEPENFGNNLFEIT